MLLSEHAYCVVITFKMTEQVEQRVYIQFCIKLQHSSTEAMWMTQKATAMDNWWLAASSWQCACSCIMSCVQVFVKTSSHPGDSVPSQPRFGALCLLAFPKTKITLKRKKFQTIDENQENTMGQLMVMGRTVWDPKVPTLKGTEASLSSVQCFLYLVFSSINVSIFHIPCLDTFWLDLIYHYMFASLSFLSIKLWPLRGQGLNLSLHL